MPGDVVDLRIHGADQLGALAVRLKETGRDDLRRELLRGLQRAGKPLKAAAARSARTHLPQRGGLNEWVASSTFSVATRSGRDPGIRLAARKAGHDLAALNRGRLRHPLYGNRRHWFNQQIRPGWFTDPMTQGVPDVRREIVDVLEDIARRVAHG